MPDLVFFDAFTCPGPWRGKHVHQPWTLEHVKDDMKQCSIAGALVFSQLSVAYDPLYENLKLAAELSGSRNLFPVWNVIPHHTAEFPAPAELIGLLRQHNVRAVALHPGSNGWELLSQPNAPLLNALEQERVFTILKRDQVRNYADIEMLLARHPNLPLLLTHAGWTDQRVIVPLLKTYRNLHLTFNHYQAHYGLEFLVAAGLEDQLVYSSNSPVMSMGAHRAYIDYANLPYAVKAKIAGGNLTRLLKGTGPAVAARNAREDVYMRRARQGQPQQGNIIDMHMHVLDEGLNGGGVSCAMYCGGPEGSIALTQRLGYAGGGLMGWQVVSGDLPACNVSVKAALKHFPQTFWGLGSFDPVHQSQKELKQQVPALYRDKRFIGMKPYPTGLRYDDERYNVWWEFGNRRGMYALLHRTVNDCSEVEHLAAKYPGVSWLVAHAGGSYEVADMVIACIKKYPNVYAEITLTPVPAGMIEYLVEKAGDDRVVYGSDLPMRDPRQQLGWVVYARIPPAAKKNILGENALRIVNRLYGKQFRAGSSA